MMINDYFVTCPKGLEGLLLGELNDLGCGSLKETVSGVHFSGDLDAAYRVCLWSRLANRVLLPVTKCEVKQERDLYRAVAELLWERDIESDGTLYIDFVGTNDAIRNTQYGAQVVKDAIVDRIRDATGERPTITKVNPDLRINVRLAKDIAYVSIDLSGDSLHRRGYRLGQGGAPLKENLAAAVLIRAGWPKLAKEGATLIDPMCGSSTFLIEGAYIAADIAPGILREQFGFERWKKSDKESWSQIKADAIKRKDVGLQNLKNDFFGYDIDAGVLKSAVSNIEQADLSDFISVLCKAVSDFKKPTHKMVNDGLVICNPPYGERLGEVSALREEYLNLAKVTKEELPGWQMGVFTGNADLGKAMRLRPKKKYKLFNGAIPSELLLFDLLSADDAKLRADRVTDRPDRNVLNDSSSTDSQEDPWSNAKSQVWKKQELTAGATMIANRLRKNKKRFSRWVKSNNIECYRLYDADMPEYSAAIDVYGDKLHIQEYQAPRSIDATKAEYRFDELVLAVCDVFELPESELFIKTRKKNRGSSQYEKAVDAPDDMSQFFSVTEQPVQLWVNLSDYLDSGLFLDHRPLRRRISQEVKGKTFLNLFCYTASITAVAAVSGASSSVSVDMSNTYIDWAKRNFALNSLNMSKHLLERADAFQWLKNCRQGFDMILLDPPTFSNSKKMDDVLDIQKDHVSLVKRCMEILNPGGKLYFSNNLRSFKLDESLTASYSVSNITKETLDPDFEKNPKIHHCWEIRHK